VRLVRRADGYYAQLAADVQRRVEHVPRGPFELWPARPKESVGTHPYVSGMWASCSTICYLLLLAYLAARMV
jgi:hypothetical protein